MYFPVPEKFRLIFEVLYDSVSLMWASLHRVQVILLFGYTASILCFIPRLFGRVVVVNVDGLEWKRSKFPRLLRALLRLSELIVTRSANCIVCDSRAMQDYYKTHYAASSVYIPNPAGQCEGSAEVVRNLGLQPQGYYLVVARLEPENSVDIIIEGFKTSCTQRRLVIVGPTTESKYVNRLIAMRNDQIIFLGGVYDQAILRALRRGSLAYIHGHRVGGTNPSLLEAMACGNVTIAYDVPFNREVAQDAGLYFKEASELAEKIKQVETNPQVAKSMGLRAKQIASEQYATERVVDSYASLLLSVGR